MNKKKIVVAMSGGVDSTTVAAILKGQGHEIIGVTMQLLDYKDAEGGCCSFDHVIDARRAAQKIDIPHYVVSLIEDFKSYVLSDYINKYRSGKTPIPCILCNQHIKFNLLLKRALELGADCLATGHYARVERDCENGTFTLNKALDSTKDQTYFLYSLKQKELSHLAFPLGSMSKKEVRSIAKDMNLKSSDKPDSTGVCFVPGGNYRDYLEQRHEFESCEGEIINMKGELLGKHKGIYSFTVGQRRRLGITTGKPMYVIKIDPSTNRVIVGEESEIYSTKLIAKNISWINHLDKINGGSAEVRAKVRYRHKESDASVSMTSETDALVEFKKPQRSITPGQAVVFYKGNKVLGGGWIDRVLLQS